VASKVKLESAGFGGHADKTLRKLKQIPGVSLSEASPVDWGGAGEVASAHIRPPQRGDHAFVRLEGDLEAIGTDDKSMFWINETTSRWDGYMWFEPHPKQILNGFTKM